MNVRHRLRLVLAGIAGLSIMAVTAATTPAAAAPIPHARWIVTDSAPSIVSPQDTPESHDLGPAQSQLTDDDTFKHLCQQTPQAATHDGWAMDRFNQCFVGHRRIDLKVSPDAPTIVATVEFDYWLLVFPQPTSRLVVYKFGFDNWTE